MKRSEAAEKDIWRTEDIFPTTAEWEREFGELNKELPKVLAYKGKLGDKYAFLACMEVNDSLCERLERLYGYACLKHDEDGGSDAGRALYARAQDLYMHYAAYASFITPELGKLDELTLGAYLNDPDLHTYRYMIEEVRRSKKHILSEQEERLLALGQTTFGGYRDVFGVINNVELPFPKIVIDGKSTRLTHGLYAKCLSSADEKVRKKAFDGMYKAVGSLIGTLTACYASSVAKDNYLATARGYKSAVDASTDADNVPGEVYTKLVKTVGAHLEPMHRYMDLRRHALGADKLHMYDLHVSVVKEADLKLSYEQAYETVLAGLAPLGDEYGTLLRKAKQTRWIDVYETENKRSGAYSMDVPGVHPYVLLNYSGTPHDVFTIAHELGHAMHSYYSRRAQPYATADYSIFVAEVASTVNEVLLLKHLLSTEHETAMRKFLLSYYLDMFRTTLYRQTMFAEFEAIAHRMAQTGKPLTTDSLNREYLKLNRKYYGTGVVHDKAIRMEWARIPHFYNAFYVYKYATGITSAVAIAHDILTEGESAVERYKTRFLRAGGSKLPYEILCDVGVDLCQDSPYETAMREFADTLAALESLM